MGRTKRCPFEHASFGEYMKYLDEDKEIELKESWLKTLGQKIKSKREHIGLSQDILAEGLHVSRNTLGLYENGKSDMPVGLLPLISTYCNFSMDDYYDPDVDRLAHAFSELVEITKRKYQRKEQKTEKIKNTNEKHLRAYIFERNGKEEIQYVNKQYKDATLRKKYFQGEIILPDTPFTYSEFKGYLTQSLKNEDYLYLDASEKLLRFLSDARKKETFKCSLAEFVINQLIVDRIMNFSDEDCRKAYMYYRKLLKN